MNGFLFYWVYAARNIWRSRRWSTFAIFSIAAGVATVVALRSLGLSIGDSLTNNLRSSLKGDLMLSVGSRGGMFSFGGGRPQDTPAFTPGQIDQLRGFADDGNWKISEYGFYTNSQVSALTNEGFGRLQFVTSLYINPETYPPTQDIFALDPPGVPLGELFTGGNEVVISKNFADNENVKVGDRVRVSGSEEEFIVRGIVPAEAEAGLRQIFASFFGFVYFDYDVAVEKLDVNPDPNRVSILLPTDTPSVEAIDNVYALIRTNLRSDRFVSIDTVPEELEENQFIADVLGRFIVLMGLGAMLIGGVGIINTMLVMVRRRTEEVAALKTFGLKGRQVAFLFTAEAVLLGTAGSLIGSVLGVLLSGLANNFGATLIQQPLSWRIYPEALVFGFSLGIIITVVFGLLPILTAARVRPGIILRPNENHVPVSGLFNTFIALVFVILSIGMIAGQIIGDYRVGIIGVFATLLLLWILVMILWIVVWIVGKVPAFGSVDLRLALRNLSTRRLRTSTTLLALSAGMFALSSIAFFGSGVRDILQFTLTETLGGNVMILPVLPPPVSQPIIQNRLRTVEGLEHRTNVAFYNASIEQINGEPVTSYGSNPTVSMRDTDNPNAIFPDLLEGRPLSLDDRGQRVAVFRESPEYEELDIQVGSQVTVNFGGERVTYEIVGIATELDPSNLQSFSLGGDLIVPPDTVSFLPTFMLTIVQINPQMLNQAMVDISSLPLTFVVDVSLIDGFISRLINQFSAIPILVGLLSLGAAAVIMANTVALATLERRRQIGILKAVGLKGNRILRIMLLENTIISLLGGVLGIGLSALGVLVMTSFGLEEAQLIPTNAVPIAVVLVLVAVFIGVAATLLSASVAVRERVLNVLRYE